VVIQSRVTLPVTLFRRAGLGVALSVTRFDARCPA